MHVFKDALPIPGALDVYNPWQWRWTQTYRRWRKKWRSAVDILVELLNVVVTLGVIVAIAIGMAALFIIVLSLATGIDSNIQTDDERS